MVVAGQCLTVEGRWVYPTPHTQLLVGRRVTRPVAQHPQTLTGIILECKSFEEFGGFRKLTFQENPGRGFGDFFQASAS